MRNYAETCKDIWGYNLVYNFFVHLLPLKLFKFSFCGVLFKRILSMGRRHFQNMLLRLRWFLFFSSFIWHSLYREDMNFSILHFFFHYHLNLLICCKTKLKKKFIFYRMSLFYRMNFFTEWFFLTGLNILKGDTNIYFK